MAVLKQVIICTTYYCYIFLVYHLVLLILIVSYNALDMNSTWYPFLCWVITTEIPQKFFYGWWCMFCWNLLESTPSRITLIKSSNKWTWIIFIISNSKPGIWLCSQPRIYVNSQYNLHHVIKLDHTRLCPNQSTNYTLGI